MLLVGSDCGCRDCSRAVASALRRRRCSSSSRRAEAPRSASAIAQLSRSATRQPRTDKLLGGRLGSLNRLSTGTHRLRRGYEPDSGAQGQRGHDDEADPPSLGPGGCGRASTTA